MAEEGAYRKLVVRLASEACGPGPAAGVEVGVAKGKTSELLLRSLPQLTLTMIDPWTGGRLPEDPYLQSGDTMALQSQEAMDQMHDECVRRVGRFERIVILRMTAHKASKQIQPGSQAFVFVDGDHTEKQVWLDSIRFWSKLRAGGRMIWHDHRNPSHPGVAKAVEKFCWDMRIQLVEEDHYVAWAEKTA